jgi:hypothetical protein
LLFPGWTVLQDEVAEAAWHANLPYYTLSLEQLADARIDCLHPVSRRARGTKGSPLARKAVPVMIDAPLTLSGIIIGKL